MSRQRKGGAAAPVMDPPCPHRAGLAKAGGQGTRTALAQPAPPTHCRFPARKHREHASAIRLGHGRPWGSTSPGGRPALDENTAAPSWLLGQRQVGRLLPHLRGDLSGSITCIRTKMPAPRVPRTPASSRALFGSWLRTQPSLNAGRVARPRCRTSSQHDALLQIRSPMSCNLRPNP